MKVPRVFPMSIIIYSFQYSEGRQYILIQTRAMVRFSLFGLKRSFQGLRNRPAELKEYGPFLKILVLSSSLKKMMVKKPLAPNWRS